MADSILAHNLRTRILPDMVRAFFPKIRTLFFKFWKRAGETSPLPPPPLQLCVWIISKKNLNKFCQKIQKTLFWGHLGAFWPKFWQNWIFLEKKALSAYRYSNYLTLCQKSEKTIVPFPRKTPNWQIDRQTDVDFIVLKLQIFMIKNS